MTPELERTVKHYKQWFGSYKKSGELVKVQVWLTASEALRKTKNRTQSPRGDDSRGFVRAGNHLTRFANARVE